MKTLGQINYETLTYAISGTRATGWDMCLQQDAWEAAAQAVIAAYSAPPEKPIHILEIADCGDCVYVAGADQGWDTLHCRHPQIGSKEIGEWKTNPPIPDWCPLPKKENA